MCQTKSAIVACQKCGAAVVQSGGAGRPKKWCSSQCRQSASHAKKARTVQCRRCQGMFVTTTGKGRLCHECHHKRERNGADVACKTCGKAFYRTPSGDQAYCSRPCLWYAQRCGAVRSCEDWIDNEAARTASVVRYCGMACKGCGGAITRVLRHSNTGKRQSLGGRDYTRTYCSRRCRFRYLKARSAARTFCMVIVWMLRAVLAGTPACSVCGAAVPRGRTTSCSNECSQELGRQKSRLKYERATGVRLRPASGERPCRLCDRTITPDVALGRGRSVCDYCNLHRGTFKSRAMMYGVHYEHVSRVGVFRRDGWRCQLCRKKVLKKAKRNKHTRKLHPRTASLDHIVPMSKGGPHAEANVQCACLACNVRKNARLIGQRRLF
jgi:predicted nucleic acid-binding Zn ribbon protein